MGLPNIPLVISLLPILSFISITIYVIVSPLLLVFVSEITPIAQVILDCEVGSSTNINRVYFPHRTRLSGAPLDDTGR